MKILFTCIGRRVELVQKFLHAAEKEKIELEIHGADSSSTAPALFFCHKKHLVPFVKTQAYIPTLLKICSEEGIDLVIPTIDTDLLPLIENKNRFEAQGVKLLLSNMEFIKSCRNKMLTNQLFRDAGLCAPCSCSDVNEYSSGFPAFIKPIDGSSSVDAYRVDDARKLKLLSDEIKRYIIQPYVCGEEYTVDIFCDFDGNPVYITPRKRLAMRSGEVIKTEIEQNDVIIEEIERLVAFCKPCGALTIQLLRDNNTGINWYIEINPRFGGGAPLTMDAGADSAVAVLRLLAGKPVSYQRKAAENKALYLRFDQSIKVFQPKDVIYEKDN